MNHSKGFTIIELVIVVVILGLLAVTALPRFFSAQESAQTATVEGVAGGIASAVGLVRAQWELEGRPSGNGANANQTIITYDTSQLGIDGNTGFPTSAATATNTLASAASAQNCLAVFTLLLQSPPSAAVTGANFKSVVYVVTNSGSVCYYHHSNTLSAAPADNAAPSLSGSEGFSYNLSTGAVAVFKIA